MTAFNPNEHDNAINPYTLPEEKQAKIMAAVDDSRLSNPSGDYFKLEINDEVIEIPKAEKISIHTENENITTVSTITYIKNQLRRADTRSV